MKELIKPKKTEEIYEDACAYCEVYDIDRRQYYTTSSIGYHMDNAEADELLF